MFSRARLRAVALVLLGFLAFTQSALAIARCDWQARAPARAVAGDDAQPCHEAAQESSNPNLCLTHCQSELQSLDKPTVNVHAMPATPVLSVPLAAAGAGASRIAGLSYWNFPSGAPPPQFLLQVIRQ